MVSTHLPRSDLYSVLKDTLIWGEVEVISLDFTVCYSVTVFKKKQKKILTFFKMGNSHVPGIYRYIVKYGLLFTHQENTAHIQIPFPTKEDILKPVPKLLSTSLFSLPENKGVQYRPQVFLDINTDDTHNPANLPEIFETCY